MSEMSDALENASGNRVFLQTMGFSLLIILLFTLIANMLPQVEGEAPEDTEVDLGALTMDSFIAMGETLFSGKGTCTLCHNDMGRAPDILVMNMLDTTDERLKDERYKGEAKDSASYLRESMLDPSAYVVASFGKKGSNDSKSPMPTINKAPIGLSNIEIDAIIAFLQTKDGGDATVELPTEAPVVDESAAASANGAPASAATAEEAIAKYGCQACHSMLGTESSVGPDLAKAGARMSAESIRQSILEPNAVIAEGFDSNIMPFDFAERMTVKELTMITKLLGESK